MNKVWKWILIFVGALIVVFLVSMAFLSGFGRMGYLGGMHRGIGMMGWGRMMFFPLGCLLGLAVLGLAIYGVVALFSRNRMMTPPPAPSTCPNCGRVVEKSWVSCPYCGHDLHPHNPDEMKPQEPKSV